MIWYILGLEFTRFGRKMMIRIMVFRMAFLVYFSLSLLLILTLLT